MGISWRVDDAEPGVAILNRVEPGSPAMRAGLRVHDRIELVNDQPVTTSQDLAKLLQNAAGPTELLIERAGQRQVVSIELPPVVAAEPFDAAERKRGSSDDELVVEVLGN